ncbi:MAG: nucleoside kinase [Lachnospiraceae bacterium]|nr:nucleoside kinase [Candidatus Colinaster scatohippi]
MAKLTINGTVKEYAEGTSFEMVANDYQKLYNNRIALVIENGKLRELYKRVSKDATIEFVRIDERLGHKTYERSATMLFVKALSDVVGGPIKGKAKVEFTIGDGVYITPKGDYEITDELIVKVNDRMNELVEANIPIKKRTYPIDEAIKLFASQEMDDKVALFKYRQSSTVNVYSIEDYNDYYYGYMLPSTGYIKYFQVLPYEEGFILLLPNKKDPEKLKCFEPRENLFNALNTSTMWSNQLDIDDVGDLNNQICAGNTEHLILVQEALQERRIGEIASEIAGRGGVKFVMIAGPSSSGKTSFSHRLSIQLTTHGLNPHPIALDNYFVNREDTPRDEKGDYDYECLGAIDVEQFNKDMLALLEGKEVEMPRYNFLTGKREYKGDMLKLEPDDILVIEGIHGLNDKMSYALPGESKFKIYISALTSLNVDGHNRIPTTDGRLLRRMVRDYRTRGASAKRTIQMWPNVRKGEEENIFPFQEGADVMFNSVLIYELAALKQYAEPILYSIGPDEPEYYEARRLLKFLGYFLSIPSESLPHNSIAREFVGGSCFDV